VRACKAKRKLSGTADPTSSVVEPGVEPGVDAAAGGVDSGPISKNPRRTALRRPNSCPKTQWDSSDPAARQILYNQYHNKRAEVRLFVWFMQSR
jgi:hypothetical protein